MYDKSEIRVKAGDGGDGDISFRREKYVPYGGPDGGDGGNGGDVIIKAEPSISSLRMFRRNRLYKAVNGENGKGGKKHGKDGENLVLMVPVGTIALNGDSSYYGEIIADCEQAGKQVVVARGGKGGMGNARFVSPVNQAPRIAQKGETGEERSLILELRLIADVGIVGSPNVGKSTLLAAATAAKPKIASYPFTTLEPILGVIEVGMQSFVIAEIPGLIDGAHLGRGLGHDFLRHIMRTRLIIHLLDGTSVSPVEDMARVNAELSLFDTALALKPQLVVVNKIDLPQVQARLSEIKEAFSDAGTPVCFISAETGEGVSELIIKVAKMLSQLGKEVRVTDNTPVAIFRPQPRSSGAIVNREGEVFIVISPEFERIITRADMANPEVRRQLRGPLARLGISRALKKAGVKPGDKVRCGSFEWEW
jgi:GTP-binding protein